MRRILIRTRSDGRLLPWVSLAEILEQVLPVRFVWNGEREAGQTGELTVEDSALNSAVQQGAPGGSTLSVPQTPDANGAAALRQVEVKFSNDAETPFSFKGATISTRVSGVIRPLVATAGERVLASIEGRAVWTVSSLDGAEHYRSALALPPVPAEGSLIDVLDRRRFLEVLPLLHWLRGLTERDYQPPPIRACFIIDDPNLHWPTYGYVDYARVAAQAAKHNYHVAFATIPLDAWFSQRRAVELFERNRRQLSLLIHGNNHTYKELWQPYSPAERRFLLAQAVRRIERLERTTGLNVTRVMAPPHGACKREMLEQMPEMGFEGATIEHSCLRSFNRGEPWTRKLGCRGSELFGDCPVLPRWGLTDDRNAIRLALYLNQPVLLLGHHQELRGGTELMDEAADFINRFGTVAWSNLSDILRSNYLSRINGSTLAVKPLAWKLVVRPRAGVEKIVIEPTDESVRPVWKLAGVGPAPLSAPTGGCFNLPERFSGPVFLERVLPTPPAERNGHGTVAIWPFMRRLLTESRDRLSRR